LYYYGARYYDPRTSVWQSPDPILGEYMSGKPNGGVFNPKNLNMFGYTYNNPVNLVDPDGEAPRTNASSPSQTLMNQNATNMIRWIREKEPSFGMLKNINAQGKVRYNKNDISYLQTKLRKVNSKKVSKMERLSKRQLKRESNIPTSRANIGKKRDAKIPSINSFRGPNKEKIRQGFYENTQGGTSIMSRHEADKNHENIHFHSNTPKRVENGQYTRFNKNGPVQYKKSNHVMEVGK